MPGCKDLPSARDDNAVAAQTRVPVNEEAAQIADCEICTEPLTTKSVFSCNTCYNLICAACVVKVVRCPYCRSRGLFANRNVALEKFLTTINLPCRNQRYGCKVSVDGHNRQQHESQCEFSPFLCPHLPICSWTGDAEQLQQHLEGYHKTKLIKSNKIQLKIRSLLTKISTLNNRKKACSMVMYCYSLVFICRITLVQDNMIVDFMQVKACNLKKNQQQFGLGIDVSSVHRSIKGIIPLPVADKFQKITLPTKLFLAPDDFENDNIDITLNIKNLDDILFE